MAIAGKPKRLGEMLVENTLLTDKQLSHALVEHKRADMKLGKYLVHNNIVNENAIVEMLSHQLKISKYHPDKFPVSPALKTILPFDTANKYQIAPLIKQGRLLKIATTDPL